MEKTIIEGGIIAGNKLIAEFMGGKLKYFNITNLPYYQMPDKQRWMPERLVYHSDWSSLMPVVEKIGKVWWVDFENGWDNLDEEELEERKNDVLLLTISTPIKNVWEAVYKFCQWYSQGVKPAK